MKMKFRFRVKDVDYKQFFLKYGEWIGLAVALLITLSVLFPGVAKIFGSGNPTSNAHAVHELAARVERDIQTSPVPETALQPSPFVTDLKIKFNEPVDYQSFATELPWFVPRTLEDTKRRNPEILSPVEFQYDVVRADIPIHILLENEGKIQVLKSTRRDLPEKVKKRLRQWGLLHGGGGGAPRGGGVGGMMGRSSGMGGDRGGKSQQIRQLRWVDLGKIDITEGVELAQEIYPTHMVVISGCFPFKDQLENFRRALRKSTLKEFLSMISKGEAYWEFKQVDVERQVLKNGKIQTPWEPYNDQLMRAMVEFIKRTLEPQEEDPELKKFENLLNPGLIMTRPKLAREKKYAPEDLPGIRKTLDALKKSNVDPAKRELSDLAKRSLGKAGYDPWNPFRPVNLEEPATPPPGGTAAEPGAPGSGQPQRITPVPPLETEGARSIQSAPVPEMALVRIVDPTVQPGYTYQYRLKVRMLNPNYKQRNVASRSMRDTDYLVAKEWTMVQPIEIPPDLDWYVMSDKRDPDKVTVQIHRWLDHVALDRSNPQAKVPVGEWTILESTAVRKGEYIGAVKPAKVPIWRTELARYELAHTPRSSQAQVPVDFSVRSSRSQDPALLVDFGGGKATKMSYGKETINQDLPVQLLVLSSDGKLLLRSSEEDLENKEREERYTKWKEWVTELEKGKKSKEESIFDQRGGA